jgi:hypothetical protein
LALSVSHQVVGRTPCTSSVTTPARCTTLLSSRGPIARGGVPRLGPRVLAGALPRAGEGPCGVLPHFEDRGAVPHCHGQPRPRRFSSRCAWVCRRKPCSALSQAAT